MILSIMDLIPIFKVQLQEEPDHILYFGLPRLTLQIQINLLRWHRHYLQQITYYMSQTLMAAALQIQRE